MEILNEFLSGASALIPTAITVVAVVLVILATRYIVQRQYVGASSIRFKTQIITMVLSLVGVLIIILVLPVSDSLRGQLLGLLGVLLSAAIALSSTTFIGNIMAGLMLRAVRGFRSGDFIQVTDHFGRITERSLFHVEIQSEDRDLTTLPNLYLVTNPVKVIRSSGTIISTEVSLGYDLDRTTVADLLVKAASDVSLQEPFVHVTELGDFSVTYRVSGLLTEIKQLISMRSRLRELVLDRLHSAGIEIVSPTFMNTRDIPPDRKFIPIRNQAMSATEQTAGKSTPERVVFDKADQAESLEKLKERHDSLGKEIEAAKQDLNAADNEASKKELTARLERLRNTRQALLDAIKIKEQEQDK